MAPDDQSTAEILAPLPKRPGRPKGLPKTGGRKPGGKNKVSADLRAMILERGKPIELLCDISRGVKIRVGPQAGPGDPQFQYPTLGERAQAAKLLLDKLVPAALPLPAPSSGVPEPREQSDIDVARHIAFTMSQAARDKLPEGSEQPRTWDGMKRVVREEPWDPDEPAEVEAREKPYRRAPIAIPAPVKATAPALVYRDPPEPTPEEKRAAQLRDEDRLASLREERAFRGRATPNVVRLRP